MFIRMLVLIFTLISVAAHAASGADSYPNNRPVRILLPFSPGGSTDVVARIIGPKLHEILGQPFVIENRPGASGNIAVQIAVESAPDGHTLLLGNIGTNAINPILFSSKLGFDASKQLTGITLLTSTPNAMVTGIQFPANSLKEFFEIARKRPGELNHSATIGGQSHLIFLQLLKTAGVKLVHIPTKGGAGSSIPPLISGEIHISHINIGTILPVIKQGRAKALAVTTEKRLPELPDVPTIGEAGFPGITADNWTGLFVNVKTPEAIIGKLHRSLVVVMKQPGVISALASKSTAVELSPSPRNFNNYVRSERVRFETIIRENKISLD